jgi:hypothetical protein
VEVCSLKLRYDVDILVFFWPFFQNLGNILFNFLVTHTGLAVECSSFVLSFYIFKNKPGFLQIRKASDKLDNFLQNVNSQFFPVSKAELAFYFNLVYL